MQTLYTLPCCQASSLLPSPGTWVNGLRGKWNKGRRGVASRGSCEGSAWFSAPLADSFQTACRCSPPPAGSCKTGKRGWCTIRELTLIRVKKVQDRSHWLQILKEISLKTKLKCNNSSSHKQQIPLTSLVCSFGRRSPPCWPRWGGAWRCSHWGHRFEPAASPQAQSGRTQSFQNWYWTECPSESTCQCRFHLGPEKKSSDHHLLGTGFPYIVLIPVLGVYNSSD